MANQSCFRIPKFGHFQTEKQRRLVLHQWQTVDVPCREIIQNARHRMSLLLILQLLEALSDAPNLCTGIRQFMVPCTIIEVRCLWKTPVNTNVHSKLQSLPRIIRIIVIVITVDPHLTKSHHRRQQQGPQHKPAYPHLPCPFHHDSKVAK